MGQILDFYNSLKVSEEGKSKFASLVCETAPYFKTIEPEVIDLGPGISHWKMEKRREVENHLSTVHAIAICNLCEITAGLCIEASIPDDKRWIPVGMNISYIRKAKTDLNAICTHEAPDWESLDQLDLEVNVYDTDKNLVSKAIISMKVGDKKEN